MICSHDAVLPQSSVATNVRTIEPEQFPPTSGPSLHVTVTPPQLSDAVASAGLHAGTSVAHSTVIDAGQEMEGGVLSSIVMIWSHDPVLPFSSVARKVRVIVPPHSLPTNVPSLQVTTSTPHPPVAVASAGSHGGTSSRQSTVKSAGQTTVGGALPTTVII
jgi:hypothetical protein